MPLVLAMNEDSESGIEYDDRPFESYEFPDAYASHVVPGSRFVYYRGRRRATGGRQPQAYLGTGVVGPISPGSRVGRLTCAILDGQPFESPLYFKDETGAPLEPGGSAKGLLSEGGSAN